MVNPQEDINLISQGSYGCIFSPGFTCNGRKQKKPYITKVQKNADTSNRENSIGKKVKQIKNSEDYFAPILKTCEVSLAKMDQDKITRCDFIDDTIDTKYESNKLRYVGKNTLAKHILHITKEEPTRLLHVLLNTHIRLITGFTKLFNAGILHLDVKENNIMIDDKTELPVIIDFGLSSEISKLAENDYSSVFFVYGPDYGPWCIDICMMTYIANELKDSNVERGMLGFAGFNNNASVDWKDRLVTRETLSRIINDYTSKNIALLDLFTADQRRQYNITLLEYFITFEGKPWKDVVEVLLSNVSTWDCYAVSVCYLYLLRDLKLQKMEVNAPFWNSYKKILENMILSAPANRMTSNKMQIQLDDLFMNVERDEFNSLNNAIDTLLSDKKNSDNIHNNILTTIKQELHTQKRIYNNIYK